MHNLITGLIFLASILPTNKLHNCSDFITFHPVRSDIMLQLVLKSYGYYEGKIDGQFGPISKNALINFQFKNNIDSDGLVGPQTCNLLLKKDLIIKNTDSLLSLIDDVDFKLDNFIRETERNFRNVTNDLEDLSDEFRTNSRRTKQKLADLEQARDQLAKDLKEVRALPSIIKGIQKMKEEAAKAAQE